MHKLLAFNADEAPQVEVVILSRNDPVSGMRVFRSAQHYGLPIERGVFTRGAVAVALPEAAEGQPVPVGQRGRRALGARRRRAGGARLPAFGARLDAHPNEVRIAFDGDAVLFSDEAERVYQRDGLDAFQSHERDQRRARRWRPGPFKPLLEALHRLQRDAGARHAACAPRSSPRAARRRTSARSAR